MQISEFTFRLILLFIPGIIAFIIVDCLTIHKERKLYEILIYSLLFGFLSYLMYGIVIYFFGLIKALAVLLSQLNYKLEFSFLKSLTDNSIALDLKEIFIVTFLSIPVAFVFVYLINYKILYRIAHKLNISKKYGDIDLWSYIMNMKTSDSEWVVVRDIENDLMYEGWIQAFSDSSEKNDELFLRDVKVYKNSTGDELYDIPAIYLSRERKNLLIEFPSLKFTEFKDREDKSKEAGDV